MKTICNNPWAHYVIYSESSSKRLVGVVIGYARYVSAQEAPGDISDCCAYDYTVLEPLGVFMLFLLKTSDQKNKPL